MSRADLPTSLSAQLAHTAERGPDRPALTLGDRTLTYADFDAAVSSLAGGLAEEGLAPGDRVALWMPNVPEFAITYFAISRAGGIVLPLSTLWGLEELSYILGNAEASAIVAAHLFDDTVRSLPERVPSLRRLIAWGDSKLTDALRLGDLMSRPPNPELHRSTSGNEPAVLIYTSGTTGRPKGATLTHMNLLSNARACEEVIEVGPDDRFLAVLPLFHSFGATVCMILPMILGAHSVLLPRFSPAEVLHALSACRITVFAGVPAMYTVLLGVRDDSACDLSALRICVTGGAPAPSKLITEFQRRFGAILVEGYGPTEASPVVSVNPPHGLQKIGSVGPPLPGVEVRVADEAGQMLPAGEVGEVLVRGPNVMLGYWRAPEATTETVVGGWLHTGDMGQVDEDGYLYIVGRKKEMVIVAGMNVYPREVEDVIYQLPAVADCAVVGVPSERRGEDVKAFVVLRPGQCLSEDEIVEHCRGRLAAYKVPRAVDIVPDLPRSATGKVLKSALR